MTSYWYEGGKSVIYIESSFFGYTWFAAPTSHSQLDMPAGTAPGYPIIQA